MRALLVAALLLGCEADGRLLVVVGSDLDVPEELDRVRISVSRSLGPDDPVTAHDFPVRLEGVDDPGRFELPFSLAIAPRDDDRDSPIVVTAEGFAQGAEDTPVVTTRRVVSGFPADRVLLLPMFLSRSCVEVSCPAGQTCADGACIDENVSRDDLREAPSSGRELDPSIFVSPMRDGGAPVDALVADGSPADSAAADGGRRRDAGSIDAGPLDAGMDAGAPTCGNQTVDYTVAVDMCGGCLWPLDDGSTGAEWTYNVSGEPEMRFVWAAPAPPAGCLLDRAEIALPEGPPDNPDRGFGCNPARADCAQYRTRGARYLLDDGTGTRSLPDVDQDDLASRGIHTHSVDLGGVLSARLELTDRTYTETVDGIAYIVIHTVTFHYRPR